MRMALIPYDLEVTVHASEWLAVARFYARKGYTVYVDGVCYANC